MSYFDSCQQCGIEFKQRQYTFTMCEPCLTSYTCPKCGKNLTMDDHEKTTSEYCFSCDNEYWEDQLTQPKNKIQENPYKNLSADELESKWQNSANMIGEYAKASWKEGLSKEESKRLHDKATEWQDTQSVIQKEITRRAK